MKYVLVHLKKTLGKKRFILFFLRFYDHNIELFSSANLNLNYLHSRQYVKISASYTMQM